MEIVIGLIILVVLFFKIKKGKQSFNQEMLSASKGLKNNKNKKRLYVIDFVGDLKASGHKHLGKTLNYLLPSLNKDDEVCVRLKSPGGVAMSYSLAANQLERIRKNNTKLHICVDEIAASGGYFMACVADNIVMP